MSPKCNYTYIDYLNMATYYFSTISYFLGVIKMRVRSNKIVWFSPTGFRGNYDITHIFLQSELKQETEHRGLNLKNGTSKAQTNGRKVKSQKNKIFSHPHELAYRVRKL